MNPNNLTILFDISKNVQFKLTDNLKTVHRKLKASWKVELNRSEIGEHTFRECHLFVLAGPQDKFTEDEFRAIKNYVSDGGSLMILLGEGGEKEFNTNINFLLHEYGMSFNNDAVVRPHYYKYFHPKEAVIGGGVALESLNTLLIEQSRAEMSPLDLIDPRYKIEFVYPFGATLHVEMPSHVLLSTGQVAYPFNRPLAGYYCNEERGKVIAVGAGQMFHDKYIHDCSNMAVWDFLISLLLDRQSVLKRHDFRDIEISDHTIVPDTIYLAEQPKVCLLESIYCDIPADFKKMFDMRLHSLNNNLLSDVIATYDKLNVQYEALKIIKPQFEIPLPQLQLAVFQPIFSDLQSPALELFDLEENLSTERAQMAFLTNKCLAAYDQQSASKRRNLSQQQTQPQPQPHRVSVDTEKELEYFVHECARIMAIGPDVQKMSPKEIIYYVGIKIAQYKKLDRGE